MTERLCIREVADCREALGSSAYLCISRLCRCVDGIWDPFVLEMIQMNSGNFCGVREVRDVPEALGLLSPPSTCCISISQIKQDIEVSGVIRA
jgi:hypothetical protein